MVIVCVRVADGNFFFLIDFAIGLVGLASTIASVQYFLGVNTDILFINSLL